MTYKKQVNFLNIINEQSLEALFILLVGFQKPCELSKNQSLNSVFSKNPQIFYENLIAIVLRLIFILHAEARYSDLSNPIYVFKYSLKKLFEGLYSDYEKNPGSLELRYDAWEQLLNLFRIFYSGIESQELKVPSIQNKIFESNLFDSFFVSDDVVLRVLEKIMKVDGEYIDYRKLEVENLGEIYESMIDFEIKETKGRALLVNTVIKKQRMVVAVDVDYLLSLKETERIAWLKSEFNINLSSQLVKDIKKSKKFEEIIACLSKRVIESKEILSPNLLYIHPVSKRRQSGSHYTPTKMTKSIIETTLRPLLEGFGTTPTDKDILSLKICDPAMGTGAFLLQTCRTLGDLIIKFWLENEKENKSLTEEEKEIIARRLVIQNCLYGVDINPFAVEIAKLSLCLLVQPSDKMIKSLEHSLVHGDALVGLLEPQLKILDWQINKENNNFLLDELPNNIFSKNKLADEVISTFFSSENNKERRASLNKLHLKISKSILENTVPIFDAPPVPTLHWPLVFPEVFDGARPGFDAIVGNPPFMGKNTLLQSHVKGYGDWLQAIHPESHGNADLVAHFFRRAFTLLRPGGALGLIATNTIAQGDTRSTGLRWICLNGGTIYEARKRYKWPGVAAVVVSVVHLVKGAYAGVKRLDGKPVEQITAFLFAKGGHEDPKTLAANAGKSFVGSYVLGMGFTFDDSGPADDDTPGIPSPIATKELLIAENPKNAEVIFPYIGGEEVNSSPTHAHHRYVINFGERSEAECRREWPDLMAIVERKVKPGRISLPPSNAWNRQVANKWWLFGADRKELAAAIAGRERVLAIARVSQACAFMWLHSGSVFSEQLIVCRLDKDQSLSCLQSTSHELWARFFSSSLGDGLRYTPSDCFETFPFPAALLDANANNSAHNTTRQRLEAIGERYHQFRAELMVANNEGLTRTYNRFHDPAESSPAVLALRRLHGEMDQAVLDAYGWSDVPTTCGFGLDYLDIDDDAQLPDDLQERIDGGELFFREPGEALAFQSELQAKGAISGRQKLSWRYRWPEAVRDDVLARLLALNNERYSIEIGLH